MWYLYLITLLFLIFIPSVHAQESNPAGSLLAHQITKDVRADKLRIYLAHYDSPLVHEAEAFIREADKYDLDWKLVAAISGLESTFGKHIPTGSFNAWGWGIPTGSQSGIGFSSWEQGIATVSEGLRKNYLNKGALTIEQIGRIYAASPTWAPRVRFFMENIESYTPVDPVQLDITI